LLIAFAWAAAAWQLAARKTVFEGGVLTRWSLAVQQVRVVFALVAETTPSEQPFKWWKTVG